MKFIAAALALATAVSAGYPVSNGTVAYTTEVVTALTTYCPYATTLSHNGQTYTVTEATTLTITNCPCTVTKPVTTSSVVMCNTCGYKNTTSMVYPTTTPYKTTTPVGTGSVYPTTTKPIATAGANKAVGVSGAGLALALGVAALL